MKTTKLSARKSRTKTSGSRSKTAATLPVFDNDSRNDIVGIILSATAIALAIALLTEGAGIAGDLIVNMLLLGVGTGAYIVPLLLLVWGVSFFVRAFTIAERRVGTGLGLVLLALISMFSVSAPIDTFWEASTVQIHGGYLGGAIAWVLTRLVGSTICYVLLAAIMLIGLVITGLSISGVVEWVTVRFQSSDTPESRGKQARPGQYYSRRFKTLPLHGTNTTEVSDIASSEAAIARRSQKPGDDPQSRKKTLPSPHTGVPRAMEGFDLPPMSLLNRTSATTSLHRATDRELKATATLIENTLATFDIPARVVDWISGPTVTMFELELPRGIKVNRITTLVDDLALSLAAPTVRILAPIPGKSLVGIEVPNDRRSTVTLGDVLENVSVHEGGPLLLGIGKDVSGENVLVDLASMPHLLIAGSTGTGKSVCINALLSSILMRATPAEVRLILIDPKRIELSMYNGVPHLYVPVVTEAKEAASALAWAVSEMERRLKQLQAAGARNIGAYNAMLHDGRLDENASQMPYFVIVIDELADLMMVAAREVEDSICRLAQLARAAGIHLIVATQRPSTDIITGLIKTNITSRIAFAVGSSIDSRVILDQPGAEKLVGLGDMLFSMPSWPKPKRIQGAYISEDEINALVSHLRSQAQPEYHEEILHLKIAPSGGIDTGDDEDPYLWEAADIVVSSGMGSTSLLQRRLKVGYARAGRIMDMLEARGVVGPPDGSRPREVLVDSEELQAIRVLELGDSENSRS